MKLEQFRAVFKDDAIAGKWFNHFSKAARKNHTHLLPWEIALVKHVNRVVCIAKCRVNSVTLMEVVGRMHGDEWVFDGNLPKVIDAEYEEVTEDNTTH